MPGRPPSEDPRLGELWAEYKELSARCLPGRAGRFVQGRRFDRLVLAYALYSVAVLGVLALGLALWPGLLDHWPTLFGPGGGPLEATVTP